MTPQIVQLKIILKDTAPFVWRTIQISENASLRSLKHVIDDVMGWKGYHLSVFSIEDELYGDPDTDYEFMGMEDDSKVKIGRIAKSHKNFQYTYDFGDNWIHDILIEGFFDGNPKEKYPICIAGEHAAPPEDCGGIPGFEELKEAFALRKTKSQKELVEWYREGHYGRDFNPKEFNLEHTNLRIGRRQKLKVSKLRLV